jgi:hypothetical protein
LPFFLQISPSVFVRVSTSSSRILQAPWGWHDSVETCRCVIICKIIVHLLVIVQNNKICTVQVLKFKKLN